MSDAMKNICKEKAEAGDAGFAIAFALIELAEQQAATASALRWLGTGDAGTTMGAIEYLGSQVEKAGALIADALQHTDLCVSAPVHVAAPRKPTPDA